jgi:hypothetical protein
MVQHRFQCTEPTGMSTCGLSIQGDTVNCNRVSQWPNVLIRIGRLFPERLYQCESVWECEHLQSRALMGCRCRVRSSGRSVQPETLNRKKTAEGQDATSYLRAVYCTFGFMLFHARLQRRVTLYSHLSAHRKPCGPVHESSTSMPSPVCSPSSWSLFSKVVSRYSATS